MRLPDDVGRDFTEVRRCSGWRRHGAIGGRHTRSRELVEMLNEYFESLFDELSLPDRVRDALRRALAFERSERLTTARELAAALEGD